MGCVHSFLTQRWVENNPAYFLCVFMNLIQIIHIILLIVMQMKMILASQFLGFPH